MEMYLPSIIKSFKHDGHLHRMWLENWLVPDKLLHPDHAAESMHVFINRQTPIQEADGKQWISRVPAVSFFIPGQWFNVVGLLEEAGVRYYCNIASPPFFQNEVLTYIDYDLDIIISHRGVSQVVDQEEYELHKTLYHYSAEVNQKVIEGLHALEARIDQGQAPFNHEAIIAYYEMWNKHTGEV
ncbi:UPF0374 protein [Paenibacillus baekrokdamisoli]|uniref:UPF0374 protein n=1 Tax=Paenibacillus baekrokdamisoli TaxID=1712516 RepID=A0A3G9IW17_9BACL|nr:DUF402 domain-containing protein [Paenibacillus baekrokdamisoli]MBB3068262.1 hypothetical protein [Paenibacillus baekrokdamisoli]BBH22696.1 UPF0374 protein [Paenibacillus baekrokdamisoli]